MRDKKNGNGSLRFLANETQRLFWTDFNNNLNFIDYFVILITIIVTLLLFVLIKYSAERRKEWKQELWTHKIKRFDNISNSAYVWEPIVLPIIASTLRL